MSLPKDNPDHTEETQRRVQAAALEAAANAIVITKANGEITWVNSAFTRLTGYRPEEVIGKNPNILKSGAHPESFYERLWETVLSGEVWHGEMTNRRKDGTLYSEEQTITPVHDTRGLISHFIAIKQDVTERKKLEDEIQMRQQQLDAFFAGANAGLVIVDKELRFIRINETLAQMNGVPAQSHIGRRVEEVVPHLAPKVIPAIQSVLKTGTPVLNLEVSGGLPSEGGRQRHWIESFFPIVGKGGEVEGVGATVVEVTSLKRAEAIVEDQLAELEQIYRSAPVGLALVDKDLVVLRINDQLAAMRQGSVADQVGKPLRDLLPDIYSQVEPFYRRVIATGEPILNVEVATQQRSASQRAAYALVSYYPLQADDGSVWAVNVVVVDITERRQLEEQLRQAQKMEAVGQLAGGVAHDFNNLLGVILGYSEIALQAHSDDEKLGAQLTEIQKAGRRAADLTRQLLAFSRQQVLEPRVLNLNAVIHETEKMLRRLIGEDIEIASVLQEGLGAVKADPGQIEQVLMNLVVNARDAMPRGGKLTIETRNADLDLHYVSGHYPAKPGPYVMLAVSDTGTGMDEETKAHIFEPFFTTKEKGKGTGLGLSTVYGIVKQSGGYVWVYSEPGQGSSFKVYLPRVGDEPQMKSQPAHEVKVQGSETILLVEDEVSLRRLTRQMLEMHGYTVLEAEDATQALNLAEEYTGQIHLLLTDVVMPGLSGRELYERLKGAGRHTKVLYMSGYMDDAIVRHGVLESGMAFLHKPFGTRDLAGKVREVLDEKANA